MYQGTVRWFDRSHGYGFISCLGNDDIFVHHTSIMNNGVNYLVQGQIVEFDVVQTTRGLQAKNVVETKATL